MLTHSLMGSSLRSGRSALTASRDGAVRLWDLHSLRCSAVTMIGGAIGAPVGGAGGTGAGGETVAVAALLDDRAFVGADNLGLRQR